MKSHRFKSLAASLTTVIGSGTVLMAMALALTLFHPIESEAQVSASAERFSPLASGYLSRARSMNGAGNYAGVIDQLQHLATQDVVLSGRESEEAVYLLAEAYYQRGDERCIELLKTFRRDYPASLLTMNAYMAEADFYFFAHDFSKALSCYNALDYSAFDKDEFPLYTYRRALSMIKTGHYDEAVPLLNSIENNDEFNPAARFYKGYIDYVKGDYQHAYRIFNDLEDYSSKRVSTSGKPSRVQQSFAHDASYYMTQIEYVWKQYDNVIAHGRSLLQKQPVSELVPETRRVVGMSYFKRGEYNLAKNYLEEYAANVEQPAAESVYALGVIEYNEGSYLSAREKFSSLTDLNNDISQSSYLYIGQCDVELGENSAAVLAFDKAANMSFDPKVSETALYNYVTAATRGNTVPFKSSVELLEKFIVSYPNSGYSSEVEEYLATAYYNDKNYSKALASIQKIKRPSEKVLSAKQKILYELGMEAMNNGRASVAADYLKQAVALGKHDASIAAQANLWLGDAEYSMAQYKEACTAYNAYLNSSAAKRDTNRALAYYNLAYSYYMLDDYRQAINNFSKALSASPSLPKALTDDARIRLADCRYYTGDYHGAMNDLTRAITDGAVDSDYATYRRALMYGLNGDTNKKLSELSGMESKYPESRWLPSALMEKAMTLTSLGKSSAATEAYATLSRRFPQSAEARKATLSLAIEYMKRGDKVKSVEAYKEVISKWPSSTEASTANEDLRRYYASVGDLPAYAEFLKSVPGAKQLNVDEMEDLTFDAAETAYAENSRNITLLQRYVEQYPDGRHLAAALIDIASSRRESGDHSSALEAAERLIESRKFSPQYPEALLMKAEILENNYPSRKEDAMKAYETLELYGDKEFLTDAYTGIMRTSSDPLKQVEYARKARLSGGLSAEDAEDAYFHEAVGLERSGKKEEAKKVYAELSHNTKSEAGAKSAVALGRIYLEEGNTTAAEKTLLEFTDEGTPHEYWLAAGFIALADTYKAMGKKSLAKEYLTSLRDNYPKNNDDIPEQINKRLKEWK